MENEGEEKSGEQGKENTEMKKEEEKKGGGEKGGMAPGRRGNEAENTHKGNGKPKDGDRKGRKDDKEEEVPRQERRQRKWEDRGIRIGTTNNR